LAEGADHSFTALGPHVSGTNASQILDTTARLEGLVNPNGKATSYVFEYVNEANFVATGFEKASSIPVGGEAVGSGTVDLAIAQQVSGLTPLTTYHFRVVATNPDGTAEGERDEAGQEIAHILTTFPSAGQGLPDGRAYEQASPIDKNGANVAGGPNAVQAATDGNGITFYSNAGLPGAEGAQGFPIFLASRGSDWTTQGLLPPAATGPIGRTLGWGEDLAWAYDSNFTPGSTITFYARDSATRAVTIIASELSGKEPGFQEPAYAGAAAGGQAVLFEDRAALVPGAVAAKPNVYLWDRASGAVSLAAVLNNGQAPSQGAFAGPYNWFPPGSLVTGGAAKHYYTQDEHAISSDGSHVYFTAAGTGRVYVRVNPTQPQSPLDSGENCTVPADACTIEISASQAEIADPNGEKPAAFAGATSAGDFALLMSSGKLTDDATTGALDEGKDLYRYDSESGELLDLSVDPVALDGAEVQGVLGMSEDGESVYFVANGVLAPGATAGTCGSEVGACNIYVWHGGEVDFVARVSAQGDPGLSDASNWIPNSSPTGEEPTDNTSRVSANGDVLLFRSRIKVTTYDNHGLAELYRFKLDAGGGKVICVSCGPTQAPPTGNAAIRDFPISLTAPRTQAGIKSRNLSQDGNRVFFDTPDKLVANDTNGVGDVYEWEAKGSGSCQSEAQNGGCLYLISSGTSPFPSYFGDASPSGNDVFLYTSQPLVAQDRDELQDVYDARVGGGIPSQNAPLPVPCVGEACAGQTASPPTSQTPGSSSFVGPTNSTPVKCKKGFKKVKRHGKTVCVKVKHKKQGHGRAGQRIGGAK
jgi:hypothetical protein